MSDVLQFQSLRLSCGLERSETIHAPNSLSRTACQSQHTLATSFIERCVSEYLTQALKWDNLLGITFLNGDAP